MDMIPKVVFIGSGNVASHLAPAIEKCGDGQVIQVYSRNLDNARSLSNKLKSATVTDNLADIQNDADIYIVSVKDDCIPEIVEGMTPNDALWVHTSGSVGMEALSPLSRRYGVFYPMQTFSKTTHLNLSEVPLFIEGSNSKVESEIRTFAENVFSSVIHADSELRRKMHIAAVFCCNFTNYLWAIADELLRKEGLSFKIMEPLIMETMRKALSISPEKGQTGPALRGDLKIMSKHEEMLPEQERLIYKLLSDSIYQHFNS